MHQNAGLARATETGLPVWWSDEQTGGVFVIGVIA